MRAQAANETEERIDWQTIDWPAVRKSVRQLRQRIFRASKKGDGRKVRALQKLMLRSRANRLLSVRQVAQVNAGRHTPGVDKIVVRTPQERARLAETLSRNEPWRASPARRISRYIDAVKGQLERRRSVFEDAFEEFVPSAEDFFEAKDLQDLKEAALILL